jgi:microcystin-dependent protein
MSDQFLAEIRLFACNFAPVGWATCSGQILPISQNTALFSLLGTNYGGNGTSTFGLPNLQGALPVAQGQGAGLSLYDLGETGGTPNVTVLTTEMPAHTHPLNADKGTATSNSPTGAIYMKGHFSSGGTSGPVQAYKAQAPTTPMAANAIGLAGGGQPHNNLMPYLTLNYCIALQGIFPPRS